MFVYAIYNEQCRKIYIWQTENLDERIELHNNKEFVGSYTSRFRGKWELIYKEEVKSRKEALTREKQLKSYQGRKLIKKLIHSPVAQW